MEQVATTLTGKKLVLTPAEIMKKLKTDKKFGVQFIVENQPNIIIDRLKAAGVVGVDTPAKAHAYLTTLIEVEPEKVRTFLNAVPYNAENPNWTGTMDEYFPTSLTKSGGFWSGILSGVGSVLSAVGSAVGSGSTNLTPEQAAALKAEEEKRAEEERKATQRRYLVWGIVAIILLIVGVMIFKAKSGTKKSS